MYRAYLVMEGIYMTSEILYDWWLFGTLFTFGFFFLLYIGTFGLERLLYEAGGRIGMFEKLSVIKQFLIIVLLCIAQLVIPVGIMWLLDNDFIFPGLSLSLLFVFYFIYLIHLFSRERI